MKSRTEGVTQTQQARYLRITISEKLNVPIHRLQEGHPLNPEKKGEDKNSRERTPQSVYADTPNRSRVSPGYVTQHFHYVITRNGLKQLRFHDLRHSCASLLLAHDVPMKAIQEWLGHSNFSITANLYSHLEYNAKVNSAETIARVLGGKSEDKSEAEKPAEKKKTTRRKSTSKAASKTPPKKTGGRKKKSDNPEGTGESQMSTL